MSKKRAAQKQRKVRKSRLQRRKERKDLINEAAHYRRLLRHVQKRLLDLTGAPLSYDESKQTAEKIYSLERYIEGELASRSSASARLEERMRVMEDAIETRRIDVAAGLIAALDAADGDNSDGMSREMGTLTSRYWDPGGR